MWLTILAAAAACYLLKLAGLLVPQRFLQGARLKKVVDLMPVGLLAALIATQTLSKGTHLTLDWALIAGTACAAVAVWRKAPFLLSVAIAAAVTAAIRFALS